MKKLLIGLLLMSVLVLNSGCFATIRCVQRYNDKVDARAIELKMLQKENGEATGVLAVDLLQAKNLSKGYWSAWKNEAGSMTAAVGIDTLWMGAAYVGGKAIYDAIEDDGDNNDLRNGKVNVTLENGTGNTVNIVYGDNNDSNNDENMSNVGDSNFDED